MPWPSLQTCSSAWSGARLDTGIYKSSSGDTDVQKNWASPIYVLHWTNFRWSWACVHDCVHACVCVCVCVCTLLVGMQTSTATSVEIPLKNGNRATIWPSNPIAGHTHWRNQNWKSHVYANVHHSTVYNSQDMEATSMSISRWMDKKAVVHIHNGVLLSH